MALFYDYRDIDMTSSLSRSVGYFGKNLFHDVIEVQFRLKNAGFPNLAVDGDCGPKTVAAIREYQKQVMSLPDGLVEVDGATIRRLQSMSISQGSARRDPIAPPVSNTPVAVGVRKDIKNLSVSPQGHALIKNYESLRLKPYYDGTGHEITEYIKGATIGYGHLIHNPSEFEIYKNGISEMKATEFYLNDISELELKTKKLINSELSQNEYDAVMMFVYNIGYGEVRRDSGFITSEVLKILNGASEANLDEAWLRWQYSNGHITRGVINRRKSELNVFHNGIYAR